MQRSPNAQLAWLSLAMFLGMTLWFSATAANAPIVRESHLSAGETAWLTGAALAWVYPPGMKIAAGWFDKRRSAALGILIGALTVGSAFPHLLVPGPSSAPSRCEVSSLKSEVGLKAQGRNFRASDLRLET